MAVQAGYLRQLKRIAGKLPILCAGDIFDRWNTPPELINFALKELPDGMHCIPGQHDLPNHRIDLMHRSGYGVLARTGKIIDIQGTLTWKAGETQMQFYGYGWGQEIVPPAFKSKLKIAIVHRYVWTADTGFPGATEDSRLSAIAKQLRGYDVAVFGDNHKGFLKQLKSGCTVLNCGGFIRRKSDERNYRPSVGILYDDGTVEREFLDTSADVFHEQEDELGETPLGMQAFINELEMLGEHGMDFRESVLRHIQSNDIRPRVREIVKEALDAT